LTGAVSALVCCVWFSAEGQCPDFVKGGYKQNVPEGNKADAPEGWFVYSDCDIVWENASGLYKCPTQSWNPQRIPGTQNDGPGDVDITQDGEWIVYYGAKVQKMFIIKPDGSKRTEVPTPGCTQADPFFGKTRGGGLYRNSPKGFEVHYLTAWNKLNATQVIIDDNDNISFGSSRLIADMPSDCNFQNYAHEVDVCVNGSHIWARQIIDQGNLRKKTWLTIPDNGNGTATINDQWQYTDVTANIWGCGFGMSMDGSRVVSGWGAQGTVCVPCQMAKQDNGTSLDHKGFVIETFREPDEPKISKNDIESEEYIISVNWTPAKYHFGDYQQVDFGRWYWTNIDSIVIGTSAGSLVPDKGIWMVDWVTNTWTLLSEGNLRTYSAAAHFNVETAVKERGLTPSWRNFGSGSNDAGVFDIRGRRVAAGAQRTDAGRAAAPGTYLVRDSRGARRTAVAR
jgi:hypothetical protein